MKKLFQLCAAFAATFLMFGCNGSTVEEPTTHIGLQLYTVRDQMEADFYGTLKAVADMGYEGVEFAGLFNYSPSQVQKWCKELGLTPISAHVPLADMLEDINSVIKDYSTIGCKFIVVPYVTDERRPGGESFLQMIEEIKSVGAAVKAAGMTLLYHNHDFEFAAAPDGSFGLDYLYSNVPADLLQTELDECWVAYSGQDPLEYLKKYADRSPVVHFKDYFSEGKEESDPYALIGIDKEDEKAASFEFRPLGKGMVDIKSLYTEVVNQNGKWIIVEQDQPSMGLTPMECAKVSLEYLVSLK